MYAYIRTIIPGEMPFVEIIAITPTGGVPPRPHPEPPLGIWGPTDPRPTLPIAGWDPIHGTFPPWVKPPEPGDPPAGASVAVVVPLPPSTPPATPPAGISADSTQMLIWFGPGTLPTVAWVPPYVDASPPKPETPAPAPV